ncbi:MAG: PrgI family protein [Candidatus Woesebacteria bacterium]|nr:PrgI family protein [Candidatus Woesebacteria bacterium]
MEQHPIPQQISSYQFKLVGDMTLKQFFQVAGGVLVSLIIYSTSLYPLIKWPLILFFVLLGVALAFLPFQERPLEKWIVAFLRSIYSPTIYNWKKTVNIEKYYTEEAPVPEIKTTQIISSVDKTIPTKLEEAEKSFLSKISSLWTSPTAPISIPSQIPTIITKSAPKLFVEERGVNTESLIKEQTVETAKIEDAKITSNEAQFSIDAAPPSPSIVVNTVVGQVMDENRRIIESAILEIKDVNGRPVRALRSNKAGHFIIVTPLANGKYEMSTEKEGFTFDPVSFETKGEIIPPIVIKGVRN